MRKYRKGELRKMSKECWDLDYAFVKWLYPRLKLYKKEAGKIVDLTYHKFTYKGKEYTQIELIDKMIDLCGVYFNDKGSLYVRDESVVEILNIWAVVGLSMWW